MLLETYDVIIPDFMYMLLFLKSCYIVVKDKYGYFIENEYGIQQKYITEDRLLILLLHKIVVSSNLILKGH